MEELEKPIQDNAVSETATETIDPKDDILFIQTPIFILFAEYLGYVSRFIPFAEDWCDPKKPMPKVHIQTLLEREAKSIFDDMCKIWTEEEINKLYRNYYPCGLNNLEEDLNNKKEKKTLML